MPSNPKKKRREKKPEKAKTQVETPEEDRFNFGGLPNRDLKKNLGCG